MQNNKTREGFIERNEREHLTASSDALLISWIAVKLPRFDREMSRQTLLEICQQTLFDESF